MADITAARINNLQSRIELILGVGSGQNGYGQTLTSSQVSSDPANNSSIITAEDLNAIYADILKARVHQVGPTDGGIAEVIQNLNVAAEETSFFVNDSGVTSTDPDGSKKGILDFERLMAQVEADKTLVHPTQATLEPAINSVRISSWNGLIYHEVAVTFSSENHRRFFFNTGGEIRFTANNSGAGSPKGLDWAALCQQVGTIKFRANGTYQKIGTSADTLVSSTGNYNLTSSYQQVYQKIGSGTYSGVYAGNLYTIKVRSDINNRIIFRIEFNDVVFDNNIDNNVDGRLESIVQHYRATNNVIVPAPTYFNNHELA